MKTVAAIALALLIPFAALAANADRQKATDAATAWLALVDANNYAQSWKTAGTLFESHVTEAQWEAAVGAARGALGPVVSRDVASVDFSTTLPGAPDGQYAVVQFDTKFANKEAAIETMAMAMDGGSWKTVGYHVR